VRGFWPVFKRELFSLFVTPLAWVLLTAFLVMQGVHFFLLVTQFATTTDAAEGPVQTFFGRTILLYLVLMFLCPLLTMRLFAEERRGGTLETLLTAPVGTVGIVLGKFCAVLATYAIVWAPTLFYVVIIAQVGEVDWRVVGSSYLGVVLVGAGYLAIGTMTSAFTQSQLTAALLSAMIVVAMFMIGFGEFVFDAGPAHDICSYVSIWAQMNDFSRGVVDLRRLTLDATMVAVPLFVTVRTVDAWRWG
jgi:ABC-2 type transport system permease protein